MKQAIRDWVQEIGEAAMVEACTYQQLEVLDRLIEALTQALWDLPAVAIPLGDELHLRDALSQHAEMPAEAREKPADALTAGWRVR